MRYPCDTLLLEHAQTINMEYLLNAHQSKELASKNFGANCGFRAQTTTKRIVNGLDHADASIFLSASVAQTRYM